MDDQARIDAYEIFKTGGYNGTQDEFIELISSNKDAFTDSLSMFREGGYTGQGKDYVELLGLEISGEETEDEEVTEEVEVEDKYKVDTNIPKSAEEVEEKYDPYLALLEDDKGNIIESQTVARDDEGNLLQGDALKEHIAKIKKDKEDLIKLVGSELDEVSAAEALRNIAVKALPTEKELIERIAVTKKRGHQGMMKSLLDKDGSIDLAIPTEANVDKWKSRSHEDLIKNWVRGKDEAFWDTKEGKEMLANPHRIDDWKIKKPEEVDPMEFSDGKHGLNYGKRAQDRIPYNWQKHAGELAGKKKASFERNYDRLLKSITKTVGLEENGGKVTNDKQKYLKSLTTDNPLIYLPTPSEIKKDPTLIKEVAGIDENLLNTISENEAKDFITQKKFNSKKTREEIDAVLEEFEGEKGVSAFSNIVNAYATVASGGWGKYAFEGVVGKTIDEMLGIEDNRETYKQNQEELAEILELSQQGNDLLIAKNVYDLRNEVNHLVTMNATLQEKRRELEANPNRTQADIDAWNAMSNDLLATNEQIKVNMEYLGDLTFEGTNMQDIIKKTAKTYDELAILENIAVNSGVRIVTGLGSLVNEMNAINVLEWAGVKLEGEGWDVGVDEEGEFNLEDVRIGELSEQGNNFVEKVTDIFGETQGNVVEHAIRSGILMDKSADELLKQTYQFGEGLLEQNRAAMNFDEIDSIMDGLTWGTEMMTGQALNLGLSIAIPGSGGLIISALSEAGNQMHEMKNRMEGEEWSDKEKTYIQDFKKEFGFNPLGDDDTYKVKPEEYNALQFYGTAALYGTAEYVSEKITLGNFKMGAKNLRKAFDLTKAGKKGGLVSSNKINQKWLNLKETGKDFAKGMPGESFGEGGVTITQNFAEKYILGNKDVSLLDGVTESMVSGAVMSGTMQSPAIMAQTYQAFRGPDRNAKIAQRGADIISISNSIKGKQLQLSGLKPTDNKHKTISEAIVKEEVELHKLMKEQLKDQNKVRSEIVTFTPSDRQSLINIFNTEHKIRNEIDGINANTAIKPEVAEKMIQEKQTELLKLEAVKNYTIGNAEWNADKTRSSTFANNWRAKNGTLGDVEMIVGNNNKEALDAGLRFVDTRNDLTSEEKNVVKEQMKEQFEIADLASRGDQTVNGMAFGDNLTIETTDANGVTTKKTVDIPITFAMNKDNLTVQSHEIGHHTLFKEFMRDNPDAVGLVQDLEAYVKRNYPEAYKNFLETKELYGKYDSKGELTNQAAVAEEKLARLSDFMRQNNLEGMRSLHNKLFGRFKKFNDGSGQIRTGKDVFDMLTSFNQSFERGTLTGLASKMAEGTAEVSRKKKGVKKETIDKDTKMKKSLKDSSAKKSLTKAEKAELTDLTNEAPGPKGKDGKYQMTKKEFLNDKNKAFTKVYTAISQGKFDGLIINKLESGKDIYGETRESIIQQVRDKLADHLMNFDPSQNNSLFGWMNSYIGKRVGDVTGKAKRKKLPGKKISTDQTIGEQGRTIAETLADDTDIDQKLDQDIVEDTIDNMRTKLGIEKGGPIYNKVLDSVRKVLGTKLPEVTNKKFKEDLKKAFDKELFKEIKKFIGTRAKYEAFLNENFETVFNSISQSTANKRFRPFVEPLIDPTTGKQARPDNNPLFRKRDVSKAEFMEYFLGKDVGASTKGTRKDALAGAIAQELAFDATMEVLDDPAVQNRIKDIYELQGLRQAENYTAEVGKTIDRIPGSKFSITKKPAQTPLRQDQVITEVKNLNEFLNNKEQDIRDGKDLSEIIDSYINKQTPQVKEALSKYVSKLKQIASKHRNTPITLDTFKQLREGGPEGTLKFVSSMPAFIKDQANIENFELKTEAGTEQYFDFITELTSIMDPSFTDSSIFKSTIGRGGKKIFYDSKTGGVKRLNTNEASNIISKGKKQKLKFDPKKAIAISSAQYNKIDSLMKSYTVDQRNDPKIQKKIAKQITGILGKEKMEAIQAARDYLYSKLNEYVQSQKTPAARNKAIANVAKLLEIQSSLTSGIPRQGAVPTTISINFSEVATKKKRDGTEVPKLYHKEHNLPQVVFNANVLASIIDGNFDQVYPQISKTYNQSILDTDIQLAQDYGLVSKEFYAKYPSAQLINTGRTAEMTGYEMGMDSEALFVVAAGNAPFQLDLKTGLTLDKVIYNKLGAQDVFSHIGKVADMINKDLKNAPLGDIVIDKNNQEAIFSSKENINLFNEIITNSVNDQSIDTQTIELGIKLENQENYNNRDKANNKQINNSGVTNKFSKSKNTTQEVIDESTVMDKALNIARDPNAPIKKIRVFDFDDTLARTKSNVLYTMPDGTTGKLTAEDFAKQGDSILEQGGKFDFSEFNKVMEGKKGPLFEVAKKIQEARGTQDVFVLTARSPEAGPAIKQFLDSLGLNIPQQNITGLGNSSPLAKSNWMVNKAAEGYNDFYFADDHLGNVDAVDKAMSVIDVKSKTQQAKIKFSKTVDQTVNDIIEHKFGIKSEAEYSDVKARLVGRKKGRFKFFVPPSAEDFVGLLYSMLGKGEVGDMQMEWFKEHLIEPYGRAMENISRDQNRMVNDFKVLKDQLVKEGLIPKNLNKKAVDGFTYQDVARVLAWHKQGLDIPGISKSDLSSILKFAKDNPAIDVFAQNLIDINKGDGYAKPGKDWLAGTISTDLLDGLRTGKRSKYLQQWKQNVDIIFSNKNLNKMEAAMGSKWREAMENMLDRMESGRNRSSKAGRLENQVLDYINNSVGTVMFFNMRSALLQTISAINFVNWGSNNILKAGAAFANQPQYWKDFMELMNSEFLVERRNGLKLNVSESEIADAAATSKNKAKAAISYILQKGYLPTQFADSFAIASGGATFYRNRLNELIKDGMPEADAKKQAFLEFREIAEESQQSSRPDRISQQQASSLGRIILAFANTPMQYNRIIKKAASDVINGRGDTKSNISKIVYYAAIQNIIFNSLQQALFALAFDDEEEEKTKQKYYNVANGMLDSILRGSGIAGTAVSTLLAVTRKALKEAEKDGTFPGPNYDNAAFELLNFSPPIDIKVSKLRYAGNNWKYEGWKHDEANWGIDDPAWKSAAYVISSLTNVPVDRLLKKMDNVQGALNANEDAWKRVAMALGWSKWQLKTSDEIKEHRAEEKPIKREALKRIHGEDKPEVYNKAEQEVILKKHGYSDEEIKAMKKEEDRVAAILRKQKETGKVYKPQSNRKYLYKPVTSIKQTEKEKKEADKKLKLKQEKEKIEKQRTKYKNLKKPEQVHMLDSLGLSKKEIRGLQYEKDRVAKLMELMNK